MNSLKTTTDLALDRSVRKQGCARAEQLIWSRRAILGNLRGKRPDDTGREEPRTRKSKSCEEQLHGHMMDAKFRPSSRSHARKGHPRAGSGQRGKANNRVCLPGNNEMASVPGQQPSHDPWRKPAPCFPIREKSPAAASFHKEASSTCTCSSFLFLLDTLRTG